MSGITSSSVSSSVVHPYLDMLPPGVGPKLEILKHLDIPDLVKIAKTSREWEELAYHNVVWLEIARKISLPVEADFALA